MINRKIAFENVRLTIYCVVLANGLFIQYFAPFNYLCDKNNVTCAMCGMRKAIDCILKLDFVSAYQSNPYIIILIVVFLVIVIDTICIFYNRIRGVLNGK